MQLNNLQKLTNANSKKMKEIKYKIDIGKSKLKYIISNFIKFEKNYKSKKQKKNVKMKKNSKYHFNYLNNFHLLSF